MPEVEAEDGVAGVYAEKVMAIDILNDKRSHHPTIHPFGLLCLLQRRLQLNSIQSMIVGSALEIFHKI